MKKAIVLALMGVSAVVCLAQSSRFPPINLYAGDPTGNACTGNTIQQSSTTGLLYTCQSGTMKAGGSAGSGTVSGQSSGKIPLATGATTIGSQSHLDDGVTTANTITSSVNVAVTGTVAAKNLPRNVLSYGADPTNVSDSSTAFTNCLAAGVGCYVPPGSYKISATVRYPNCSGSNKSVSIWGDPGASPNGYPAILNMGAGVTAFAPACPLTAYQTISFKYLELKGGKNGIDLGLAGLTDLDHMMFWDYTGWGVTHIVGEKHHWRDMFCWHQTVVAQGCLSFDDPTTTADAAVYAADAYWSVHSGFMDRIDIEGLIDQGNSTSVEDSYVIHSAAPIGVAAGEGVVGNFRLVKPLVMWAGSTRVFEFLGDLNIGSIEQPVLDIIGQSGTPVSDIIYVGGSTRSLNISRLNPGYPPSVYYTNGVNIRVGVVDTTIADSILGGNGTTFYGVRMGTASTGGNQLRITNSSGYLFQEGANAAYTNGTVSIIGGLMKSNLTAGFVAPGSGDGFDYQFYMPANGGTDNCSNWIFARSKPSLSAYYTDMAINCTSASIYHPLNLVSNTYFNGSTNVTSQWGWTITNSAGTTNQTTLTLAPTNSGSGGAAVVLSAPVTASSVIASDLGTGTSPVCPNGTAGALTTSGCASVVTPPLRSIFTDPSNSPVLTKGSAYGGWTADAFAAPGVTKDATHYVMTVSMWSIANSKWASGFFTSSNLTSWSYASGSLRTPGGSDYILGNGGVESFVPSSGVNAGVRAYYFVYAHYPSASSTSTVAIDRSTDTTLQAASWTNVVSNLGGGGTLYSDCHPITNPNNNKLEIWCIKYIASSPDTVYMWDSADGVTFTAEGLQYTIPGVGSFYPGEFHVSYAGSGSPRYATVDGISPNATGGARYTQMLYSPNRDTNWTQLGAATGASPAVSWKSVQTFDAQLIYTDTSDGKGLALRLVYAGGDNNSGTDNTDSSIGYGIENGLLNAAVAPGVTSTSPQQYALYYSNTAAGLVGSPNSTDVALGSNTSLSGATWNRLNTANYSTVIDNFGNTTAAQVDFYTSAPAANPISNFVKQFEVNLTYNWFANKIGIGGTSTVTPGDFFAITMPSGSNGGVTSTASGVGSAYSTMTAASKSTFFGTAGATSAFFNLHLAAGDAVIRAASGQSVQIGVDNGAGSATPQLTVSSTGITTPTVVATGAAATAAAAQVSFGGTVAASSNCGSLAGAAGCLVINVAGTTRYVPYY